MLWFIPTLVEVISHPSSIYLFLIPFFLDWRRPPCPIHTADYATYVQILTWFFDTPSPEAPFSVHRMALAENPFSEHHGTLCRRVTYVPISDQMGQWTGPGPV